MKTTFTQIEIDFIEFMAAKRQRGIDETAAIYAATKKRFNFEGFRYRGLCDDMHHLYRILYDDKDEKETIDSFAFHSLITLFRFIAYTFPGWPGNRLYALKRTMARLTGRRLEPTAEGQKAMKLLKISSGPPRAIVDYGCGLGSVSFELGKRVKGVKVYLVDIDCLTLDFAVFRFNKHGIPTVAIRVTKDSLYPQLPQHDICIADEIMEHTFRPLEVYGNIASKLSAGGILYGNFNDHRSEMFHVCPGLEDLRQAIVNDFTRIAPQCYRKK